MMQLIIFARTVISQSGSFITTCKITQVDSCIAAVSVVVAHEEQPKFSLYLHDIRVSV